MMDRKERRKRIRELIQEIDDTKYWWRYWNRKRSSLAGTQRSILTCDIERLEGELDRVRAS